eukprot:9383465-Lingulodinium_polyedra.AAC.1
MAGRLGRWLWHHADSRWGCLRGEDARRRHLQLPRACRWGRRATAAAWQPPLPVPRAGGLGRAP